MEYVRKYADISKCGTYRYLLEREWVQKKSYDSSCLFVMLNPSTADANKDDPTIRKCVGFASRLGFRKLSVVNLFAYRATDPKELVGTKIHGPRNQEVIERAARSAGVIICAWGANKAAGYQEDVVCGWLQSYELYCLGLTATLKPCHPLRLPYSSELITYK